jgi:hypothetical protein
MIPFGMLSGPEKMPGTHLEAVLAATKRASARSAAVVHLDMKKRLDSLATIASTAPWVGLFGTVLGVVNSFPGFNGDKTSIMAAIFERLSDALIPTAFGLNCGVNVDVFLQIPARRSGSLRCGDGNRFAPIDERPARSWIPANLKLTHYTILRGNIARHTA